MEHLQDRLLWSPCWVIAKCSLAFTFGGCPSLGCAECPRGPQSGSIANNTWHQRGFSRRPLSVVFWGGRSSRRCRGNQREGKLSLVKPWSSPLTYLQTMAAPQLAQPVLWGWECGRVLGSRQGSIAHRLNQKGALNMFLWGLSCHLLSLRQDQNDSLPKDFLRSSLCSPQLEESILHLSQDGCCPHSLAHGCDVAVFILIVILPSFISSVPFSPSW